MPRASAASLPLFRYFPREKPLRGKESPEFLSEKK
nr:MAG TPA_asm: hypothetical protein [Caudoviricetes sp.]